MGNLLLTGAFCTDATEIIQFIGKIFFIFKIIIPILLLIWGFIDLGKAVVASKDDEIKKATKSLMTRAIAAVIIFFLPTLVGIIFGLVNDYKDKDYQKDYVYCDECFLRPYGDCKTKAATRAAKIK